MPLQPAGIIAFATARGVTWPMPATTDHSSLFADLSRRSLGVGRSLWPQGLGRGQGVGRGLGVGVHLPAHGVGVGVAVGVGAGAAAPDCAQYLLPLFNRFPSIST